MDRKDKVIIKKDTATFNSYEGCLSVPNLRGKVKRYNTINVTYYTMDAKKITENIKKNLSKNNSPHNKLKIIKKKYLKSLLT